MMAPLSQSLKSETATAHGRAESEAFIEQLMAGVACPSAFSALVAQQFVIYRALETTLREQCADDPLVSVVDDRRLDRLPALERDMVHHFGADFEVGLATGAIRICPATAAYADVLTGDPTPETMLANHYVRYLGDLSGGQIIARMVQRHYGVADGGLNFYRFEQIAKPKPYKDAYRAALDSLTLSDQQRRAVLGAASESFELNRRVFADLARARVPEHTAAGAPL